VILDELAASAKERANKARKDLPLAFLKRLIPSGEQGRLQRALSKAGISVIAEVKKASPSKGLIASEGFDAAAIAREYEAAGADALSVLTEPTRFFGASEDLSACAESVHIPILRKDFTVDEYQIYEAAALGASAVLLIAALLDDAQLKGFRELSESLGLDSLVECHDEREIERASAAGSKIIGINNRNLRTFETDVTTASRLRACVGDGIQVVFESGMLTIADVRAQLAACPSGLLIGEMLMRAEDRKEAIRQIKSAEPTKLKICGIKDKEAAIALRECGVEYAGFVFCESRRAVSFDEAKRLGPYLGSGIQKVGVFQNAPAGQIIGAVEDGIIDVAQLHGTETEEDVAALKRAGVRVIKAVKATEEKAVAAALASSADFLLFDGPAPGSGSAFDWSALKNANRDYFLSGGIHEGNIYSAMALHPYAIDISSGAETNGQKDIEKISRLAAAVRKGETVYA